MRKYLIKWLEHYFDNYDAVSKGGGFGGYKGRAGSLLDSLAVKAIRKDGMIAAKVYFDDSKAWRESLWPENNGPGYLPALINDGWQVKKDVWFREIPHFGFFQGAHFIEAAIMEAREDPVFKKVDIVWDPPTAGYEMGL